MEQITKVVDTFDVPIGEVWAILAAYGAGKAWISGVLGCSVEGSGVGAMRTFRFKDYIAVERLEICDPVTHCVVYRLLEPASINTLGATGTMQLTALAPNKTQMEWTAQAESVAGDKAAVSEYVTGVYRRSIDNIKTLLNC